MDDNTRAAGKLDASMAKLYTKSRMEKSKEETGFKVKESVCGNLSLKTKKPQ